jgi:hypothetical protein
VLVDLFTQKAGYEEPLLNRSWAMVVKKAEGTGDRRRVLLSLSHAAPDLFPMVQFEARDVGLHSLARETVKHQLVVQAPQTICCFAWCNASVRARAATYFLAVTELVPCPVCAATSARPFHFNVEELGDGEQVICVGSLDKHPVRNADLLLQMEPDLFMSCAYTFS